MEKYMTLEDYNKMYGMGGQTAPTTSEQPQAPAESAWDTYGVYKSGQDGSILETAKARIQAGAEAFLAANVSPENSQYANRKFEQAYKRSVEEQEKLGMVGNVAAGMVSYAPAIGLGMANPLAGGAAAASLSTMDALLAQRENQQALDMQKAGLAGLASGVVDVATGGMASKVKTALGASAPALKKLGVDVAEDVTSNVAGQAFENLAAGKDWDEDLGTAAIVGAGAGQAVRGSVGAMQKALNTPMNEWGKGTIDTISSFRKDNKITPTTDFTDNAYGYANNRKALQDQLDNIDISDTTSRDRIVNAMNTLGSKDGGDAAALQALSVLRDNNVRIVAGDLNVDVSRGIDPNSQKLNFGKQLGYSDKELVKSSETVPAAQRQTLFANRQKEVAEGRTTETHLANLKSDIERAHNFVRNNLVENNIANVQHEIDMLSRSGEVDPTTIRDLNNYVGDLTNYGKMIQDLWSSKKFYSPASVESLSHRLVSDSQRLGLNNILTGIDGKPGTFDPMVNFMAARNLDAVFEKAYPRASIRSPDIAGEGKPSSGQARGLLGALVGGVPGYVAGRMSGGLSTARSASKSQKALMKTKQSAKDRLDALLSKPNVTAKEAGTVSKIELENEGINTGTLGETSTGMNPPAATPEVAPAPVLTEAPVSVSEKPKAKRVPLGGKKPEVAQKASEGVIESQPVKTVVPAAKPEPSAKIERTRKRKEESEARKAKREAEAKVREEASIAEQWEATEKARFEAEEAKKARKSNATTIKTPKPKVEKAPEPEVETPTRKQGSKLRTPPKAVQKPVEAPKAEEVVTQPEVVETAPKATEAPSKGGWQRLQEPYTRAVEETGKVKAGMAPTTAVAKHSKAKESLREVTSTVDNIHSQLKLDKDTVADHIETLGGFEHLRQENLDQGHKPSNLRKYITDRVRELEKEASTKRSAEAASKIESIIKEPATPSTKPDAEATKQRKVEEAHEFLIAAGYSPEVIAYAKTFSTPEAIKKAAQTRSKELANEANTKASAEAKKASDAATEASKAEEEAKKKFLSRSGMEEHIDELGVSDRNITSILDDVFGPKSSPFTNEPTVAQVNRARKRIADYLQQQEDAYNSLVKNKMVHDVPEEAFARMKAAKEANKRLGEVIEINREMAQTRAEEAKAAKLAEAEAKQQAAEAKAELAKVRKQEENNKKLSKQQEDYEKILRDKGLSEDVIEAQMRKAFNGRIAPMTDSQWYNFVQKADALSAEKAKPIEKKVEKDTKEVLSALDDEQLVKVSKKSTEDSGSDVAEERVKRRGTTKAISEELKKRGLADEAKLVDRYQEILDLIDQRKALLPPDSGEKYNNLLLSRDEVRDIQSLKSGKFGSEYSGNLFIGLRLRAYGRSGEGTRDFAELTTEGLNARLKALQEGFEVKGSGPDDEGPKPPSGPKGGKPGISPKPKSEATSSEAPKGALETSNNIAELEKQYTPIYNKKFKKSVDDAVSELEEISKWAKESGNTEALEDVNRGLGSLVDNATDNQTDFAKSNRDVTQQEYNETMTSVYNQGLEDAGIAIDKWKPIMDAEKAPEGPSEPVGALSGVTEGKGSSEASEAAVELPTKPEAPKGILELPEDVKVTEKTPEKKLKDISTEKRLNLYKLAKTRMGHTQAEVDKFISSNPDLTAAEVQELFKGKTLFPETKEEAVTRAKKEGYSDEEIMDGLHKRVGDMGEDEIQSLKKWAEREEFPRGELEVIIRKKPMMTKRDVIKSQKELRDFSLRELSTKRLFTSSQYDPTLGSLSEKQRKEGIKRIEQFRGKPLDKDVKKIILETKLHRGKDAINKTPRQYLGDHLTTGEFNIFMNTAYSNRKTRK